LYQHSTDIVAIGKAWTLLIKLKSPLTLKEQSSAALAKCKRKEGFSDKIVRNTRRHGEIITEKKKKIVNIYSIFLFENVQIFISPE
jgi:hypothetical protein